jgi:hypothetical protein
VAAGDAWAAHLALEDAVNYTVGTCILRHRADPDRLRRAIDGLNVCSGCRARMLRQLQQLGPLDRALAELAAAIAAATVGSPSAEIRLPLDDRAAEHRKVIRHTLSSWCALVAEERGMAPPQLSAAPRTADVRYEWTSRGVQAVSGALSAVDYLTMWLQRHLDWLCAHPAVDDWAGELGDLHRTAFGIAYPSGRTRREVADCHLELWLAATRQPYDCPGRLTVTMRPDEELPDAVCDTCGDTLTPREWLTRAEKGRRLTAVELSTLWDVPLKTVERWARDAKWPNDGGRPSRYDAKAAQETLHKLRPEGASA